MRPDKAFWISFGIAGVFVGVLGIYRFFGPADSWNLLIALSLGFVIAGFPWATGLKVTGLFEIQRQIGQAKDETNSKIQQTEKDSTRRVDELRKEVQYSIGVLQTQITQNLMNLTSTQRSSQSVYIGQESSLEAFKALQDEREKDIEQKAAESNLPVSPQQIKLRKLESGFSLACSHALTDLPDLKCAKLLRAASNAETSKKIFDKTAGAIGITQEQIHMMQTLGLLEIGERQEEDNTAQVQITDLGTTYANHWAVTIEWAVKAKDIVKTLGPIVVAAVPLIASFWDILGGGKAEEARSK